jgi:archaeal type IV pilus assembly protein PilA
MKYKKFLKNSKAISPIFATLILIAIAVIAGVVVYMFTSGTLATTTGGGTAAQEKVSVQAVQYFGTSGNIYINVYAQNTGTSTVTVNGMIIKDTSGNTLQSATSLLGTSLTVNNLITVSGNATALSAGSYTVTLTTTKGGNFLSSSFVVS